VGATFKRGTDTEMSNVGKGCHWEQHSIEEKTPKCPLADRVVGMEMPLGAVNRSLGADAPETLFVQDG
jgi:hypothetical protein